MIISRTARTIKDFPKGLRVRYMPSHFRKMPEEEVPKRYKEYGVVKRSESFRKGEDIVFVIYDNLEMIMTTGDEPYTAQGTKIEDFRYNRARLRRERRF